MQVEQQIAALPAGEIEARRPELTAKIEAEVAKSKEVVSTLVVSM